MLPTIVVAEPCRLHRYDGSTGDLVVTRKWCACGDQHQVTKIVHDCTVCGFPIAMQIQGGHG